MQSLEDRSAVVAVENESKNDGPQSIAISVHPAPLQLEEQSLEPQQPAGSEVLYQKQTMPNARTLLLNICTGGLASNVNCYPRAYAQPLGVVRKAAPYQGKSQDMHLFS